MANVKPLNTESQKKVEADLRRVGDELDQLNARQAELGAERDALIHKAARAGLSRRQIADPLRLTRGRVQQIIDSE